VVVKSVGGSCTQRHPKVKIKRYDALSGMEMCSRVVSKTVRGSENGLGVMGGLAGRMCSQYETDRKMHECKRINLVCEF
jgi:hypothetical protein